MRQPDGYRAYLFDADGRLSQRMDLACIDDDDAMMRMRHYAKMGDAELWHGTRWFACTGTQRRLLPLVKVRLATNSLTRR